MSHAKSGTPKHMLETSVGVCLNSRDAAVYYQLSCHFSFPQAVACPRSHPCCFPLLFIHSDNHPDLCSFFLQSQPLF